MLNAILQNIADSRDFIIEVQKAMTACPALGPESGGQGELDKAVCLEQILTSLGMDFQRVDAPDARVKSGVRPNIIVKIPGKSEKTLWILGHMDVVPVGDMSLWKTDPWKIEVDGDYIYGRGVEDNQQAIVSGLLIAKALKALNIVPELTLGLIFAADEETGNAFGITYLLDNHPDLFSPSDYAIAPDFGVPEGNQICVSEKSRLWLKVIVQGKQCHASRPSLGKNSLLSAARMILALNDELPKLYPAQDNLFTPPQSTFTPTRHDANVPNINTVPAKDVFFVDCRVLAEYDLQHVLASAHKICEKIASEQGVSVEIELSEFSSAAPGAPLDSELVQKLSAAIEKNYKLPASLLGSGGGTVAGYMRDKGLNAVAWAKVIPSYHEPNERSSISNTIGDAKVMASMLF